MTLVVLVRHGRTPANASGILAGRTAGVPLDALGRRQARAVGRRLRGLHLDVVVHSPLERCAQTADLLLERRDPPAPPRHADDRLIECDYGTWSGRPLAELAKEPLWEQVQRRPSEVQFPGGERLAAMAERAAAAVRFWTAEHPEGVVVLVSHGDVIKAILSEALAQPFDQFQRIVVSPGSISVVAHGAERTAVLATNHTGVGLGQALAAGRPTVGGGAG